ncbi:MAG: translation initiation factor IF-2 [Paludibacteraceae bacterium]|jgi:translation initiation factor IF-2|nr:translation initiation factor IF-2 [Paludibacteraceae bacterium]MBQ6561796.1 translation initiation factor IF-2 [Paludibacteraceae bacterium]MCR5246946.1 translation initiation factor IF-2 [Paludibacteraceae bacterium]MDD5996151.1 translation initiation factor IF-2 [Bacteroidales bacterium]MEE1177625.1 translation initiation factor IF-2 [Paludibacteraceae bacterium]
MSRLGQLAKELNVGIATATELLKKKGFAIEDANPNYKLSEKEEDILRQEYDKDKTFKSDAKAEFDDMKDRKKNKKEKIVEIPGFGKKDEVDIKVEVQAPKLKVVGKISDAPKPQTPKPETPAASTVSVDEAKQNNMSKSQNETEDDVFRLNPTTQVTGPTVLGKIDLSSINSQTRPKKKTKEERKKDHQKQLQQQKAEQGQGGQKKQRNRIQGKEKIDISEYKEGKQGGKNDRHKGDRDRNDNRDREANGGNNKKFNKQKNQKQEISEEDVQKQIKDTLARLTSNKNQNKSGAKHRHDKRESIRQRAEEREAQEREAQGKLKITEFVTVSDLAKMMDVTITEVITTCMNFGLMVSINQRLDADTINIVASEFGFETEYVSAEVSEAIQEEEDKEEDLINRPPIVTVMGHVDHGKTSLLDYIRQTNVIAGEAGGITQHIGAYNVTLKNGQHITFLDTPGHEAFTAMRARGAKVTDIAIIIVAADDDVMPQTKEAINHASIAGVPIVFAINKIDKPTANPDKIKESLAQMNYLVEEWGGKYQSQDIAAKKGIGVDELMDKVLLEAEMLDLKANPNRKASGSVIESQLDKGRGYVATVLVSNGTLKIGDVVIAGTHYGKVKAMFNERNQRITEAGPSEPALILGLDGAPQAGDNFNVLGSEQEAREIANKREQLQREQGLRAGNGIITLDEIARRRALGNFQEMNIIVKGDVDGSVEALSDSLQNCSTEQFQINVIHKAVGQISETDVMLASASNAIIIGFQVRPSQSARKLAEKEGVDIRLHSIIYDAIEQLKDAMAGMLAPELKEQVTGTAEVLEIFKIGKVGVIAGSIVRDGKIKRSNKVRLIRDGIVVFTGDLQSLKRYKDDVKEVANGFDCGIALAGYNEIQVGDIIEGFETIEVARKL